MKHRSLTLPLLLSLLAAPALASPPAAARRVVDDLLDQKLEPKEAASSWAEAKVSPAQALEAIRARKPEPKLAPGLHEVPLKDGRGRESTAFVMVPEKPWKGGRYRVLVMLHGLGGNGKKTFELAASFAPEGTIVIGPTALKPPSNEGAEDLPDLPWMKPILKRFPRWWSYRESSFPLAALRLVERDFPVDTDHVVLIGYSMGGFGTWNLGLRFHDRFAGAAPMAGGISRQEYVPVGKDQRSRFLLGNARMLPLFVLHGGQDEVVPVSFDRWSRDQLSAAGLPFIYEEVPDGKHVMKEQLEGGKVRDALLEWIGARTRDAHPARVEHHAIGAYHGGAYWLQVDELAGQQAHVVAVTKRQRITVVASGVKKLTVFLDPERLDPKKPVSVDVNGTQLFAGKDAPRLDAVARSFARTGDPQLSYAHAVELELPADLPAPREADFQLGLVRSFK
ncbi:MAG: alpha/beta hydrolase-fold protein [Planctomycetota bacterium]